MSGTISREKAIATVFRMHDSCDTYDITDYRDMMVEAMKVLPSEEPEDWMERNKERILQAGMEGREIEFRIGGRLFAIREKAQ